MKFTWVALLGTFISLAFAGDDRESMEEILVLGHQFSSVSESGSRLDLSLREIPATVDEIDGDAMRNRRDISLLEGVTRSAGFTGAGNLATAVQVSQPEALRVRTSSPL